MHRWAARLLNRWAARLRNRWGSLSIRSIATLSSLARSCESPLENALVRYAGRHDLLFRSLHKKYEVEPDPLEEEYQASLYASLAKLQQPQSGAEPTTEEHGE
jgi:hypothetical protein